MSHIYKSWISAPDVQIDAELIAENVKDVGWVVRRQYRELLDETCGKDNWRVEVYRPGDSRRRLGYLHIKFLNPDNAAYFKLIWGGQ